MSAFGRLWRRAPGWRMALVSAVALTGLAAMFPPALPVLRAPWRHAAGTGPDHVSFHPEAQPGPAAHGIVGTPQPGTQRHGIIPFAGRQLPLPAGDWQVLAVGWEPGEPQLALFDRISRNHLTGLLSVVATGVFGGPAGPVGVPSACADPSKLAGHLVPAMPGQSPLAHECWSIVPVDMKQAASEGGNPLIARGLERLGDMHVAVPDRMLAVQLFRSDDRGWQTAILLVPDGGGPVTELADWVPRYAALLHKGFDRTATAADLTAAATRDPG